MEEELNGELFIVIYFDQFNQFLHLVNDEAHCEFAPFRSFLLKTHLQDLIETTSMIHYETFRTKQLLALKESTGASSTNLRNKN